MKLIVFLVSLHSIVIGLLLLIFGNEVFGLFGWKPDCDAFLFHQVGIFHVVLALLYSIEFLRYKRVDSILLAKSMAFTFLLVEYLFFTHESAILFAGVADGCIGLAVAICYRHRLRIRVQ